MFKPTYVNPNRRDLLKQLLGVSAIAASSSMFKAGAQTASGEIGPGVETAWRGGEPYDALRRYSLWRSNMPERYPDVIVEAQTEQDLRQALTFARGNDMQVVCRASGHSTAGAPLRNGGMMIYVTNLGSLAIDPVAKTATVQPATNMAALYAEAKRHGLDFPTADCTTVALTGFILGGGFGRNGNHVTKGPVCNALLRAEVMLASGEIVTADERSHPDLYWAMRGCGPAFFGIVMNMTLRLTEPPGAYLASRYSFPFETLPSVVDFFDQRRSGHDPQVGIRIGVRPDQAASDKLLANVSITAFADQGPNAVAEARSRLAYYADEGVAEKAVEKSEFMPQNLDDYMFTRNPNGGTHTDNINTDDAAALIQAAEILKDRPDGLAVRLDLGHNSQYFAPYGGNICYSAAGRHFLSIYADWTDSNLDALAYEWTDQFSEIAKPFRQGHYLNQIDTGVYPEKVRQSFSTESWNRLTRVRQNYDPDNRFFSYVGHEP